MLSRDNYQLFNAYIHWGIELDTFLKNDNLDLMLVEIKEQKTGKYCTKAGHSCKDAICGNCDRGIK